MNKKNTQREVYIPGDPVIEAYRVKLLRAGNSPEDIENLFKQRNKDIRELGKYTDEVSQKVKTSLGN